MNNKANFCLKYTENSSSTCGATLRYFSSLENARRAMREAFQNMNAILQFPAGYMDEDHQTVMEEDSIHVSMDMDSYDWSIEPVEAEDAADQEEESNSSSGSGKIRQELELVIAAHNQMAETILNAEFCGSYCCKEVSYKIAWERAAIIQAARAAGIDAKADMQTGAISGNF